MKLFKNMYDWDYEWQKEIRPYGSTKPHKVSEKLKYCKTCNHVWEMDWQSKCVLHYRDFPTYKLKRQECKKCKGKENG